MNNDLCVGFIIASGRKTGHMQDKRRGGYSATCIKTNYFCNDRLFSFISILTFLHFILAPAAAQVCMHSGYVVNYTWQFEIVQKRGNSSNKAFNIYGSCSTFFCFLPSSLWSVESHSILRVQVDWSLVSSQKLYPEVKFILSSIWINGTPSKSDQTSLFP